MIVAWTFAKFSAIPNRGVRIVFFFSLTLRSNVKYVDALLLTFRSLEHIEEIRLVLGCRDGSVAERTVV